MAAFSSLQQVKLLRLQDQAHERIVDYLREHRLQRKLILKWEPACTRAINTLGLSLLSSSRTSVGFVGPQVDPKSSVTLLRTPSTTLCAVGARLNSLDVTFDAILGLRAWVGDLTQALHDFLLAAENLEAIHLGFVTTVPLPLFLEQVFQHIQWKRLRKLSLQGLRLTSQDIITLIRRHNRQLRDIHLVNVFLWEGSRWRDILAVLHDEMDYLEHIDLRNINYIGHLDYANDDDPSSFHPHPPLDTDSLAFVLSGLPHHSPNTPIPNAIRRLSVDDLGDDGIYVRHAQRPLWEAWVMSSPRRASRRRL